MSCPDVGLVKALYHELVRRCGGIDAVGVKLGITHQRVSQLQNPNYTEHVPTLVNILPLEHWLGEPIVTGGLANAIRRDDGRRSGDLARETRETTYAAVDLQRGLDEGASRDALRAMAQRLQLELDDVNALLVNAPATH